MKDTMREDVKSLMTEQEYSLFDEKLKSPYVTVRSSAID